jgi:nitrate reductase gamma subunit
MFEQLVDGIFWKISLWVFAIGVLWRILSIFRVRNKPDYSEPRGSGLAGAIGANLRRFIPRREMVSRTRLQVVAGYLFHLGLFALLVFAAPHVLFIEAQTGFSWTPMPYWAFIISAQLAFIGLMLLWFHRVMHPVTRLISDADDHIAAILTFIVMLTGCMALLGEFEGLRVLHRFTVELWLVYFPFSRLMHAFMFIPSRAFTGAWFGRRGVKA